MKNIRFIQFPHPGGEHRPVRGATTKSWNTLPNCHKRCFFQAEGVRLDRDGNLAEGPLWAWGEWEPEARVLCEWPRQDDYPATLFEPFWVRKETYANLHNTDPFVFGGFYYTDCKQGTSASLSAMRELEKGSVIIFGSCLGRSRWVLDTVLVVGDYIDHKVDNHWDRISNRVPEGYRDVVLAPTYVANAAGRDPNRRLYIGATFNEPCGGMFSFFPAVGAGTGSGFRRPEIIQSAALKSRYFNPKLAQGMKGHGRGVACLSGEEAFGLWDEIRLQVLDTGCDLGVHAAMPQRADWG